MPPTNMSAAARQAGPIDVKGVRPTRVRHVVLWLTVLAYMITYMDRVVISSAMPVDPEGVRIQHHHRRLDPYVLSHGAMRCFKFQAAGSEIGLGRGAR